MKYVFLLLQICSSKLRSSGKVVKWGQEGTSRGVKLGQLGSKAVKCSQVGSSRFKIGDGGLS